MMFNPQRPFSEMLRAFGYVGGGVIALIVGTGAAEAVDLKIMAVEIVDLRDQAHSAWKRMRRDKPPSLKLVKVSFTSDIDLQDFARRAHIYTMRRASICSDGVFDKTKNLGGDGGVYDGQGQVDTYRESNLDEKKSATFTYHVFFDLKYPRQRQADEFTYDLTQGPADICLEIVGGDALFGLFPSHTSLKLSKHAVVDAIARAQRK